MKKIPTLKVKYNANPDEGIYGVSLVAEPANQSMFITLSTQKVVMADEEKRLITGVVLIPNQLIYRVFNNLEYNMVFDAKDIRLLSQDFFKRHHQNNSNINHQKDSIIKGLTFVESWIVEDPMNDKANALGLTNVVQGTWMMSAYVEDDETWAKAKSGEVKGFSIEAWLDLEEIDMQITQTLKTNKQMNSTLLDKIINLFKSEEIKMESIEVDNYGTLSCDALELDHVVYDKDGLPLVDATFDYDGYKYVTDAYGVIIEKEMIEAEVEAEVDVTPESEAEIEAKKDDEDVYAGEIDTPSGVIYSENYEVGETLTLDGAPYANADIEVEGKHIVTDENGVIITADALETEMDVQLSAINLELSTLKTELENLTKSYNDVILENTELKAKVDDLLKAPANGKLKAIPEGGSNRKETAMDVANRIASQLYKN